MEFNETDKYVNLKDYKKIENIPWFLWYALIREYFCYLEDICEIEIPKDKEQEVFDMIKKYTDNMLNDDYFNEALFEYQSEIEKDANEIINQ